MKTKFFFAVMAAAAVIGCSKEPDVQLVADGQASFLKVDFRAAGGITKATDGGFEYGSDAENAVNTVHFWFFDASGAQYPVQGTDNYLVVNPDWKPGSVDNIEEISDVVLVIKQSKTAPPAQMIAVINAPADIQKNMSKADLEAVVLKSLKTGEHFIMSNSVYADGSLVVNSSEITAENIFTSTDVKDFNVGDVIPADKVTEMNITPIEVYVERVAAKVKVSGGTGVDMTKLPVYEINEDGTLSAEQVTDSEGNVLYAKVLGWQITNRTHDANLMKKIDASWTGLGFTPWSVADLHRSYWAATDSEPLHDFTFNDIIAHNVAEDYYFENTKTASTSNGVDIDQNGSFDTPNTSANQASQLIVAAQLIGADNQPVSLAKWYGVSYTVAGLKTAMVKTVASKLYVKNAGGELVSVGVENVTFEQVPQHTETKRYEVKMCPKDGVTYYTSAGAVADAATVIGGVDPAQMWGDETNKGYTYYYLTVDHLGTSKGIVRNHCYDIKIDKIGGLGTPVYDPDMIITPEKPEEQDALNLAARINILSWHLVNQNVTLQ